MSALAQVQNNNPVLLVKTEMMADGSCVIVSAPATNFLELHQCDNCRVLLLTGTLVDLVNSLACAAPQLCYSTKIF